MDIIKQNRFLTLVVFLLVIFNVSMMTIMWLGRPLRPERPGNPPRPGQEQADIQKLIRDELGFDDQQIEEYLKMRREHRNQVRRLGEEIRQIKKQMFDEVLQDNPQPELSDSLLSLAQNKQAQIEKLTFQHFLDLKKLCRADQKDKLKRLMFELFRRKPGNDQEAPPMPPPDGRRPPEPRRRNN